MKIRVLEQSTRVLEYLKIGSNTRVPWKSILGIGHTSGIRCQCQFAIGYRWANRYDGVL